MRIFAALILLCWVIVFGHLCDVNPCQNGGRCDFPVGALPGESVCYCPKGFLGKHCEINLLLGSNCSQMSCNDGICTMEDGRPKCKCPIYASGEHCEKLHTIDCLDRQLCETNAANGFCNVQCNNGDCGYDFGDCEGQIPDSIAVVISLSAKQFLRQKEVLLEILSERSGVRMKILKDSRDEEIVFGYDPEMRTTYGRVNRHSGISNYTSVKVLLEPESQLDFDQLPQLKNRILDLSDAYNLPIPAAVLQGPRPPLKLVGGPLWPFLIAAGIIACLLIAILTLILGWLGKRRKKVDEEIYGWYPGDNSETQKILNNKGVTDISTIVSAWFYSPTRNRLLADMSVSNDEESLRMRLEELTSLNVRNKDGLTAVALAVDRGFLTLLKDLLKLGANPNIADLSGQTPLHRAVVAKNLDMVKSLLNSGKIENLNAVNGKHETFLMLWAKYVHSKDIGRLLLAQGAKASFSGCSLGKIALHYAAQANNTHAIEELSEAKDAFDVNVLDAKNRTALMVACEYGNFNVCHMLLSLGADKNVKDDMKKTAAVYATENGFHDLARYTNQYERVEQMKKQVIGQERNLKPRVKIPDTNLNPVPTAFKTTCGSPSVGHNFSPEQVNHDYESIHQTPANIYATPPYASASRQSYVPPDPPLESIPKTVPVMEQSYYETPRSSQILSYPQEGYLNMLPYVQDTSTRV
ncbi:hypothetical protein L596_020501 [Steinernema carpocapsae]|uniref:EGF-like domain-containing protein n=1 Tax=Steinernema carpocapsae TaxID=34508 RepID=A0A4U5MTT8_STECR|nr:hypothetical protein L596_020501 [Steinernema carpocapsae]